jgi:hypothetical protein
MYVSYRPPLRLAPISAIGVLAAVSALIACDDRASDDPDPSEVSPEAMPDSPESEVEQPVTCDPKLVFYPVRGRHNNGYDSQAGNSSLWTCNADRSNSDFIAGDHLGNDIWAAEGTPVVATVSGTATLVGFTAYSGNKVTIIDSCGWYHFSTHMKSIAPGITNGKHVTAGTVIGYVGRTGTGSNGVIHLHYSIYPGGNYDAGINPWPYLKAVENNVCNLPDSAPPPSSPPSYGADAETVVAAANAAGKLEVFWLGAAGAIMHAEQLATGGSAASALGGAAKELAIGSNADGRLEVFYVGTNDRLVHRVQLPTGGWSGEIAIGATGKDIAVARNSDGRLELFFADTAGAIRHVWQTAPNAGWTEPVALGGAAKDLVVGTNADGRLEVFYVGTSDQLLHRVQIAGGWSGELSFGVAAKDLAVGRNADGRLELVFTSTSDAIFHASQTAPNGGWTAASALGGLAKRLAVGANADGRLEVFYVGTSDQLFHRVQLAGGWSNEIAFGLAAKDLAVSRNADGRLELFYATPAGALAHTWQTAANSSWTGGSPLTQGATP